jgi:molybdate transport system permease protein
MLSAAEWDLVRLSLQVAALAVVASLPLALAAAWLLARTRFPGKPLFDLVVHLPLVLPPVVVGYLLLLAFGNQGWLGQALREGLGITLAFRWTGAALAGAVMAFPLLVRAIRQSLEAADPRLEEMAATLGASPAAVFLTITLPLAWPGIVGGALLAFARCLGEFGATITFVGSIPGQTETLPLAIYSATQIASGEATVWRLCLIAVALSMLALGVSEWLLRRGARA